MGIGKWGLSAGLRAQNGSFTFKLGVNAVTWFSHLCRHKAPLSVVFAICSINTTNKAIAQECINMSLVMERSWINSNPLWVGSNSSWGLLDLAEG